MFTLKSILKNHGGTFNSKGETVSFKRGYQVSTHDIAIVKVKELRKSYLQAILDTIESGKFLGVWIDKGLAYIDCSECINTKREAVKLGKKLNQISIWNWKTSEALEL
jgi:hypothetical protein